MKVVVIYYSESGNTKKIAEAIQETISKQFEVDLKKLEEISIGELKNYNLVFIGTPCHHADLVAPIKEFLTKIPNNPGYALAGFFTHACYPKGINDQYDIMYEKWVSLCDKTFNEIKENKQIDFKGYFSCMGIPTPPIEQFIHAEIIPNVDDFKEYAKEIKKHPNDEDIAKAQEFTLEILNKIK